MQHPSLPSRRQHASRCHGASKCICYFLCCQLCSHGNITATSPVQAALKSGDLDVWTDTLQGFAPVDGHDVGGHALCGSPLQHLAAASPQLHLPACAFWGQPPNLSNKP